MQGGRYLFFSLSLFSLSLFLPTTDSRHKGRGSVGESVCMRGVRGVACMRKCSPRVNAFSDDDDVPMRLNLTRDPASVGVVEWRRR